MQIWNFYDPPSHSVTLLCPNAWVLVSQKDPHSPPLCMTSFLNDSAAVSIFSNVRLCIGRIGMWGGGTGLYHKGFLVGVVGGE